MEGIFFTLFHQILDLFLEAMFRQDIALEATSSSSESCSDLVVAVLDQKSGALARDTLNTLQARKRTQSYLQRVQAYRNHAAADRNPSQCHSFIVESSFPLLSIMDLEDYDIDAFFEFIGETIPVSYQQQVEKFNVMPGIFQSEKTVELVSNFLATMKEGVLLDFPPAGELLESWLHFTNLFLEKYKIIGANRERYRHVVKRGVVIPPNYVILVKGEIFRIPSQNKQKFETLWDLCPESWKSQTSRLFQINADIWILPDPQFFDVIDALDDARIYQHANRLAS